MPDAAVARVYRAGFAELNRVQDAQVPGVAAALGGGSQTQLYYIPFNSIGTGATYTPIPLPVNFFKNQRYGIEMVFFLSKNQANATI